ncbi:hypothetical protein DL768_006031 [Monosporascus sp. mg162]|nr:hypothetical protein DL768_006031 [Monosporascus sp. mg162]
MIITVVPTTVITIPAAYPTRTTGHYHSYKYRKTAQAITVSITRVLNSAEYARFVGNELDYKATADVSAKEAYDSHEGNGGAVADDHVGFGEDVQKLLLVREPESRQRQVTGVNYDLGELEHGRIALVDVLLVADLRAVDPVDYPVFDKASGDLLAEESSGPGKDDLLWLREEVLLWRGQARKSGRYSCLLFSFDDFFALPSLTTVLPPSPCGSMMLLDL